MVVHRRRGRVLVLHAVVGFHHAVERLLFLRWCVVVGREVRHHYMVVGDSDRLRLTGNALNLHQVLLCFESFLAGTIQKTELVTVLSVGG
jgi:hypothetical protein